MLVLYNLAIVVAEVLYIFSITLVMDALVERKRISGSIARKVIHLWMGGLIIFWFLFNSQYAQLLFSIPVLIFVAVMLSALSGKGAHKKVLKFARMDNLYEVVYGPLIFMAMFVLFTAFAFRSIAGVAALCAMVFGDGIAPIAGKYACVHYANGLKSLEGSAAFFIASLVSIYALTSILIPGGFTLRVSRVAVLASAIGAIAEGVTPGKLDNLMVPILVWLTFLLV